jgi:hypothetical protein
MMRLFSCQRKTAERSSANSSADALLAGDWNGRRLKGHFSGLAPTLGRTIRRVRPAAGKVNGLPFIFSNFSC